MGIWSGIENIKDILIKLGNNLRISSDYSFALLDEKKTTILDLNGQTFKLKNFKLLSDCVLLERLSLKNCKIVGDNSIEITDYDAQVEAVLSKLTNMKALTLEGLSKLTNINFVENMKGLKELDIRGTNVSDLSILEKQTIAGDMSLGTLGTDVAGTDLSKIPKVVSGCTGSCYWNNGSNGVYGGIISNQSILNTLNGSGITKLRIPGKIEAGVTLDLSRCGQLEEFTTAYISGKLTLPASIKSFSVWNIVGSSCVEFNKSSELNKIYYHDSNSFFRLVSSLLNVKSISEVQIGWGGFEAISKLGLLEGKNVKTFSQNSLSTNNTSAENFVLPSTLDTLILGKNGGTGVTVNNFPSTIVGEHGSSLVTLEISGGLIGTASFVKDIPSLEKIILKDCKISNIDFDEENNITYLDLSGGNISNLKSFEKLKKCKYINLSNNNILSSSSFKDETGKDSSISSLGVLIYLHNNYKLRSLHLQGNSEDVKAFQDYGTLTSLSWDQKSGF